jgi:hypothetical protein
MNIAQLSNDLLMSQLEEQFVLERKTSHHILLHLKEVRRRRLYAERGFPNMFSMLVQHFHQSESSANQRLKALDLMMEVPLAEERLISGSLSLSTAAMAQRQIKREEKITGKKVSREKKAEIVTSITGKTMAQAESELFKLLPETACAPKDYERRVSADITRMTLSVPEDVREMMTRLKEIWAHVDPTMDNVEIMRRAFKLALAKCDPGTGRAIAGHEAARPGERGGTGDHERRSLRAHRSPTETRSATESAKHRGTKRLPYYGREFDRTLWQRAGSQCEYVDEKTGRRCDCKFGLQREHVIPLGKGGTSELRNMQLLCATHNRLRARKIFGDRMMDGFAARPR